MLKQAGFAILLLLCSCNTARVLHYNFPDISDYKLFTQVKISHSSSPFEFKRRSENIVLPPVKDWVLTNKGKQESAGKMSPEQFLEATKSTSLLIVRHDSLLYENYFNGFERSTTSQHFSLTKAVVSLLTGIAIEEGIISGIDQAISNYLPVYASDERGKVTIGQLLNMTAGFDCNDYNDQLRFIRLYYSDEPSKFISRRKLRYTPGEKFAYSSFNTLLLGICLEKAYGQTLNSLIQNKIWTKIGTASDASIGVFKDNTSMAYGGLASYPIDLMKFARLVSNNGNWNGDQVVPANYINECRSKSEDNGKSWRYSRGFWLDTYNCLKKEEIKTLKWPKRGKDCDHENQLYGGGYRGQILFIDVEKKLIILRLGTGDANKSWSLSISRLAELL
ncbi:MAG TPA: class A beta-lactamase-related serine hydrolase [Flavobacteriales bacterium]|nr:class A beta-lactamase-related serine hydrolase [Flavobacteriales bacterium]HIA12801.1 class A beta-lactamase-related serine hydrolase [Flavobacteriales bacterium]HIO72278.1 class A beta-lactamase-related serine hydrolase [Flavobacteriales bacterium]